MNSQSRRNFLKTAGALSVAAAGVGAAKANASPMNILSPDRFGVLVDTTVCVGCRNCEWACKTAHGMETPPLDTYKDRNVFKKFRRPEPKALTVVNEFDNPKNHLVPINVKAQCMHCDKPACVSACIVGAFQKYENGAVVWDGDKCIGCRYCMVACPFQVPTFDFDKALRPDIHKCDFCIERRKKGDIPACVDICPSETLLFGPRTELIKEARDRIKRKPNLYVNKIYGESEVGGTGWLYLASRDFQELTFPKLNTSTAPGVSEAIQHGIFSYFMPPAMLYALLGSMMWITKRRKEDQEAEENHGA